MEVKREGKFELLRVISMLGIVIFHFTDWGGLLYINNIPNRLFGQFINIGGSLGVNLFVLISGYFLINSKFKTKKIVKIILEVWTYSVIIAIISSLLGIVNVNNSLFGKSFLPITYNMYWFATTYVGMYLLFPIINKLINSLNQKKHRNILILLGIMLSIIPTLLIDSNPFYSELIWFIYLYMIAAYIRKYDIKFMNNNKKNLIIIGILTILIFLINILIIGIELKIGIRNAELVNYFQITKNNYFIMLILSIYVFMFFKNINIKNNKILSTLAKSSFAVYLIHINTITRKYLFYKIIKIQNYYNANLFILITYVLIVSIIIYLFCTLVDIIRIKVIEKPIFKIKKFDKYFEKIDEIMNI